MGIGVNSIDEDHVIDAATVNGKIHVSNSESVRLQLWMEGHYLFGGDFAKWECEEGCQIRDENGVTKTLPENSSYYRSRRLYHGPFFAIQVSDGDSFIQGAALGYMVSFKKESHNAGEKPSYFNLGLGLSTSKVRTLGEQSDGDLIPDGDQLTYKTKSVKGLLLLFSVNVF